MPLLTYPGVYVEEVSGGVRPIQAASTSTAAFVGLAEMGPTARRRGSPAGRSSSATSAASSPTATWHIASSQFFNNGGRQCYVVRATRSGLADAARDRPEPGHAGRRRPHLLGPNKGAWGNALFLSHRRRVARPRQRVPDHRPPSGRARRRAARLRRPYRPLEIYDNLEHGPEGAELRRRRRSASARARRRAGPGGQRSLAARHAPRRDRPVSLPLGDSLSFQINLDSDGFQAVTLPRRRGTATTLADVAAAIQTAVRGAGPAARRSPARRRAFTGFTCTVERHRRRRHGCCCSRAPNVRAFSQSSLRVPRQPATTPPPG